MSRRTERVEDLLRQELSELVQREMADPRVRLATIAGVDVTPNLARARVRVSALGEEAERDACVAALEHAGGFLRTQLARRLRMRSVPELVFVLDRGAEHSARIAEILEGLHHDDEQGT